MDEKIKRRYDTVHNKLIYILRLNTGLKNATNDELIEAYREEYPDDSTASETISRTMRKIRSFGLFLPTDEEIANEKKKKEKDMKQYYNGNTST